MRRLIPCLMLAHLIFAALPASAQSLPGYHRLSLTVIHRPAPLNVAVWYPVDNLADSSGDSAGDPAAIGKDAVFQGTPALPGAPAAAGQHPLILMSHGSGGNMDNMGWLASTLVQKGAIVLGVNHPGSTSHDSTARQSVQSWNRPADLSAALD